MKYNCEFCSHQFKQKNDLQRHLDKKNGCISVNQIIEKQKNQEISKGKIQELHSVFKSCLDILRNDAEHLIGDEALNELSHFLILKQAEKHIENGSIDIYNLELYKDGVKKYKRFFEVKKNITVKRKIANTRHDALIQCREINGITLGAITFSASIIKGSRVEVLNTYSSPPPER